MLFKEFGNDYEMNGNKKPLIYMAITINGFFAAKVIVEIKF
jgi:hypothetical protein